MNSFGKEALEAHNKFRAAHQAPPLTWSSALAQDAEVWAKKIAKKGRLEHDDTKDGENIYMVCGREIDGTDAVNSWYSEVKDYNFGKPGFQSNTGHFTQVVWKSSEELGIGRAKSADGKEFVVGRYKPAGNMMRAFAENVLPSKDGPVKIPEKESASKQGSVPVYRRQKHEERPTQGVETRTEEKTIILPDGTKKTVMSTVTVTLKGNDQGGYSRETVTTISETRKQDNFAQDMKTALPQGSPRTQDPKDSKSSSSTGGPKAPCSVPQTGFAKQALDAHNKYRAKHRVSPLTWSDEIAKEAQAWAEKLARAGKLQHASQAERKGYGENIAMFSGRFETAADEATNMWYNEVKDYRFDKPGFQGNTGHFTQVVWKKSSELGMGRAQTADGKLTYVVARYNPAGNMLNHFQENVFKG